MGPSQEHMDTAQVLEEQLPRSISKKAVPESYTWHLTSDTCSNL